MKSKYKTKKTSSIFTVVILIIIAVGLLGFGNLFSSGGNSTRSTRDIALSCTLDMYTKFHIHPHLEIIANGVKQTIPPNIGVTLACMHPLHTHDNIGTIHVESPEKRDFTLGDFFAVWGQSFSKDQVLDYKRDASHEIAMTVGGALSQDFENLILEDSQHIIIEYKPVENSE